MRLSAEQMSEYNDAGFLLIPEVFSEKEIGVMKAELPGIIEEDSPRRIVERDESVVRSVYGSHKTNQVFARLTRHPRILEPAMQLLESEVYVYQFKINIKAAFGGDVWEWHQDYAFWNKEDGMQNPDAISACVFLDDITEFNGPMFFIPGSHFYGMRDVRAKNGNSRSNPGNTEHHGEYQDGPEWITNLTADLKYALDKGTVTTLVGKNGIVAPKGRAGSVLLFHCNVFHGSPNNISPQDRVVAIVSYNKVGNEPSLVDRPRPDFLADRDPTPLVPLSDGAMWI